MGSTVALIGVVACLDSGFAETLGEIPIFLQVLVVPLFSLFVLFQVLVAPLVSLLLLLQVLVASLVSLLVW